jgi:hypothetical protein
MFLSLSYYIHSFIHFIPLINPDQWYQSGLLFIYFSSCMSLTRSGFKKLGLESFDPFQYLSCRVPQQPMGDEKKDDGVGDSFINFLEEAFQRLTTREASSSSSHATPFKV